MKIDSEIFELSHFLQVVIFIHEINISDFFRFDYYNLCFVNTNSQACSREKILENL
jgi:hypothetical protein